jgi:hypothetical protein
LPFKRENKHNVEAQNAAVVRAGAIKKFPLLLSLCCGNNRSLTRELCIRSGTRTIAREREREILIFMTYSYRSQEREKEKQARKDEKAAVRQIIFTANTSHAVHLHSELCL